MRDVYYTYDGKLDNCELKRIIYKIIEINTDNGTSIKVRDDIQKLLSDDEIITVSPAVDVKETLFNFLAFPLSTWISVCITGARAIIFRSPVIIPRLDVHVNLKLVTISIIALLLDAVLPLGIASQVLSLSGVNSKAFAKLDEFAGDKCILFEVCTMRGRKAGLSALADRYGKECINNHLKCKYREDSACKATPDQIEGICNKLVSKNIFKIHNGVYFYNA